MTTKHFFPTTDGVVLLGLESLVARNTQLALDAPNKVVYSKTHSPSKLSIISGGGGGHEPAWTGYVGDSMLAAAVSGEVFASPSTKQIMAAVRHVPSSKGIILCITNYTGDNLHFGLAREKAAGLGYKVGMLRMSEDVSLPRVQISNLGRRGLAGNMFILKLCGAAAENDWDFDQVIELGQSTNDSCVTVGSSLDHCHIPGREVHRSIPQNAYVLGMGIHNEPGLREISPMPVAEEVVGEMLRCCLTESDEERAYVKFEKRDETMLLINNFGGMSNFELEALTTITRRKLKSEWGIEPMRTFVSCFETSLNAPGWSLSVLNLSLIERKTKIQVITLLELMDQGTTAPAWPKNGIRQVSEQQNGIQDPSGATDGLSTRGPMIDQATFESALRTACNAALKAASHLNNLDTTMGDGDCGEAVEGMCKGTLSKLDSGILEQSGGQLFPILDAIGEAVEEVGGTLGAIISIMLAAFTTSLKKMSAEITGQPEFSIETASRASGEALRNLMGYTPARKGGRTVMDALIPFCEELEQHQNLDRAVRAAERGMDSTAGMKASYGRAEEEIPPDPGAVAAGVFLRGLLRGLES
ncbi:Dak1-domain-containing protein [Polychaeton citri CBS 116435]|uniref:Dak1-domain-containing protein n=1 Tax=Polychaeton citri CBS 116435 TaxID=1314669 RepID=A0A9P4URF0_9PEZI|nr:Dak1-domain-containing protein [Polychaeton citri CBS 116435]